MTTIKSMKLAAAILLLPSIAATAQAQGNLESRIEQVAANIEATGGRIPFRESRLNRDPGSDELLAQPLKYLGWLSYDPDSQVLIKQIVSPAKTVMRLGEDFAETQRGEKVRRLPKRSLPRVRPVYLVFRGLIEGKVDAMQEYFAIKHDEQGNTWRVILKPTQGTLKRHISQIEIHGTDSALTRLETHHHYGGRDLVEVIDAGLIPE